MSLDVNDFVVECDEHGNTLDCLDVSLTKGYIHIVVSQCQKCIDEGREYGLEKGRKEGEV